jgi:predicted ATP-dependent serine protease
VATVCLETQAFVEKFLWIYTARFGSFTFTKTLASQRGFHDGRQPQEGAERRAGPDRKAIRQGLGHASGRCRRVIRRRSRSTGSLGLDIALGIGGLPRGRVIEIYGPESSGKTTLTLQVVAEIQKHGGTAAFVDAEHALDPRMRKSSAST